MDGICSAGLWRPVSAVAVVILGRQHRATECAVIRWYPPRCLRATVCDLLTYVTARDLMFSLSSDRKRSIEQDPELFSLKFAISEKAFTNSHENLLQLKVWVHVELSVVLESNFVHCD